MFNIGKNIFKCNSYSPTITTFRYLRGKPPYLATSLKERLSKLTKNDPDVDFKVDIGLPPPPPVSNKVYAKRQKHLKLRKNDSDLEVKSRNMTLEVDTDCIKEEWLKTDAPEHFKVVAEHYNIFNDLFGDAYFMPYVIMNINFPHENKNICSPVYRGNVVKPAEAFLQPNVMFESKPEEMWTLTLVNPDGHFTEKNMEYVHWFVGNIPGGDISKGEVIWDYLPPFPPRGLGFQRFIFVLYKQEKKLDYSSLQKKLPCLELKDRSFKTLDFYRERQEDLTPAGLSFFQSDWDLTARKVFHELLNMEEPAFEYDFPPQVLKKEVWFPVREPFNQYLDKFRDPRDIYQEYFLKKYKDVDPFKSPKKPFPYPLAIPMNFRRMPSWLKRKEGYFLTNRGRVHILKRDEYK